VPGQAHGFTIAANVAKPRSRGQVALVSPDPTAKPLIVHNYYDDPEDLRIQIAGVRLAMRIAKTAPLAQWISDPYLAPASDSDEDIVAHIRARMQTIYHPVGTCKMGTDDMAVVDPQLRVRGVEALRVVDASIMPTVPRGNTNAPTIAVAERAADLVRGLESYCSHGREPGSVSSSMPTCSSNPRLELGNPTMMPWYRLRPAANHGQE
jgi:choline dehydrogenase